MMIVCMVRRHVINLSKYKQTLEFKCKDVIVKLIATNSLKNIKNRHNKLPQSNYLCAEPSCRSFGLPRGEKISRIGQELREIMRFELNHFVKQRFDMRNFFRLHREFYVRSASDLYM